MTDAASAMTASWPHKLFVASLRPFIDEVLGQKSSPSVSQPQWGRVDPRPLYIEICGPRAMRPSSKPGIMSTLP